MRALRLKDRGRLTAPMRDGSVLSPFSDESSRNEKGVGCHEIRLRVDCYVPICDDDSGAAGHQVESPSELHTGTNVVSDCPQAISTTADPANSNREFASAA